VPVEKYLKTKSKNRKLKLASEIHKNLSTILKSSYNSIINKLHISFIDVSDDLKNVKIFYTNFSQSEAPDFIEKTIDDHLKNIKFELAKKLYLRRFPKIEFVHDSFTIKNIELNQKLNEIKK
jgi:ribosome-binding factor A